MRRALHPLLGFLSGWALIVSALIFMVIATVPAGANVLGLFSAAAANNKVDVTLVGCVFFPLDGLRRGGRGDDHRDRAGGDVMY